jgi:predicted metal-dependent peptidase
MNTAAAKKLTSGRTSLVLDDCFFGSLALGLIPKEDPTCDTAWTDGRNLGYNPDFILSLTHAELTGLLRHEVLHCAMGHPWRRDGREGKRFNIAADLAINPDCGTLPKGALVPDASQLGKSAEWIYARLPESKSDPNGNGKGKGNGTPAPGKGKPDPAGEVRDAPTGPDEDGTPAPSEGEWKQRTAEALQAAKMQGSIGGNFARKIEDALGQRIDIRALLLRFFSERSADDYSWSRPNPRFLAQNLYLPSLNSTCLGHVSVLIDTSGSVDQTSLAYARSIVEQVIDECSPMSVSVHYVDAKVCRVDRFAKGEPLEWHPCGGGGTDFTSFFSEVENGEDIPVCVVGISDLWATFGDAPSVPVLWLSTTDKIAPWGETVPIGQ